MRTLFTLLFIACLTTLNAQNEDPLRELGISFRSLNGFNLLYKKPRTEDTYHRLGLAVANLNVVAGDRNGSVFTFTTAVSYGRERRRPLGEKLVLATGWQPQLGLSVNALGNGAGAIYAITPGIGYLFGFQYHASEQFYFGVEVTPSVSASLNLGAINLINVNAGIGTAGVGLTAVYRFVPVE